MRTIFPVGFGLREGNGAFRISNSPVEAVDIERGSTTARDNGNESGTADTRISLQVE